MSVERITDLLGANSALVMEKRELERQLKGARDLNVALDNAIVETHKREVRLQGEELRLQAELDTERQNRRIDAAIIASLRMAVRDDATVIERQDAQLKALLHGPKLPKNVTPSGQGSFWGIRADAAAEADMILSLKKADEAGALGKIGRTDKAARYPDQNLFLCRRGKMFRIIVAHDRTAAWNRTEKVIPIDGSRFSRYVMAIDITADIARALEAAGVQVDDTLMVGRAA